VVTYEMLTGRLPFDADTPWLWATQHMTAQPFPFETMPLGSQVPAKMKAAVMRALSKNAQHRQQTVTEFSQDLSIGATVPTALSGPRSMVASSENLGGGPSGTAYLQSVQEPVMGSYPPAYGSYAPEPSVGISPKKSNAGLIGGILAAVVLIGGVGGFFAWRAMAGGGDNDTPQTKACKASMQASREGNVIAAIAEYHKCAGPLKENAEKSIDGAAQRAANRSGCTALEDAKAAEKINLPAAINILKSKKCHGL
jgi:serine/threonine-protein kinase